MNQKNLRRTLARVEREGGTTPAMASHVIHTDCLTDPFIAMMVERVLSSNSNQYERAEAMCRLLGSYGVGNIVTGRLN